MTDRTNWRTLSHLLESGVFLLMGYQIHALVQDALDDGLDVWLAVGIGALVTALLILVRVAFVVPLVLSLRRAQRRGAERVQTIEGALEKIEDHEFRDERSRRVARRMLGRRHADASFHANEGLGWRGGAVLAWSGMRGAVTIAAAQSLPADVAYRPGLMLIAFTVAILTLVGQGSTLPVLIGRLGVRGGSEEESAREVAALLGRSPRT
ncbi:cation:proton antiporter domain-containing protein [Tessaracoccus coleopterorum]|uniref:cation:proton antiporter domain-containing protein n=1 Tax=Tessaracoccus coleopterorum TaxID=2714950 RepID=UPI0018D4A5CD